MSINRRTFLERARLFAGALWLSEMEPAKAQSIATPAWRTFRVTTEVEVLKPAGMTRVWVPAAFVENTPFQETVYNTFRCDTGTAHIVKGANGFGLITAQFPEGVKPTLSVVSHVKTRDWAVNLAARDGAHNRASDLAMYLKPTMMLPTEGIVKARAREITKSENTNVGKARAIYEWIVENTYRNPKTRGCGVGDIRFMLESGDLGGKCADLNALYVGLARAAGLPARDVYGIRIAPSRMGCKSLGVSSNDVTRAQHCRAEVFLSGSGWVPVDPADVRKVVLEEPPGHRPLQDELVERTRNRLFGSWEMNWMAYNYAQDVVLPGSSGPPLHYFMYPQAETAEGRLDSLDPEQFRYQIKSVEVNSVTS